MTHQIVKMPDGSHVVVDDSLRIIHEEKGGVGLSTDPSGHEHDEKGRFTAGSGGGGKTGGSYKQRAFSKQFIVDDQIRGGFYSSFNESLATVLEVLPSNKLKVKLESGRILVVDVDDVKPDQWSM